MLNDYRDIIQICIQFLLFEVVKELIKINFEYIQTVLFSLCYYIKHVLTSGKSCAALSFAPVGNLFVKRSKFFNIDPSN